MSFASSATRPSSGGVLGSEASSSAAAGRTSRDATASLPSEVLLTLHAHHGACHVARLNSHGRYVLTGGQDRGVHLFNARNPASAVPASHESGGKNRPKLSTPIKSYAAHSQAVLTLDITPDDATFASGGSDRAVLVWDVATGSVLRRFSSHQGAVQSVHFARGASGGGGGGGSAGGNAGGSGGANVLLAGGFDTCVRAYDLRAAGAWRPILELRHARDSVLCVESRDAYVFTGSVDGLARTYDVRMGQLREDTMGDSVVSVYPSLTCASLLVSTMSKRASGAKHRLLDAADGSLLASLSGHANASYRCRSSLVAHDAAVLAGDERGAVLAWDVLSGRRRALVGKNGSDLTTTTTPPPTQETEPRAHARAVLWTEAKERSDGGEAGVDVVVSAGADGVVKVWAQPDEAV